MKKCVLIASAILAASCTGPAPISDTRPRPAAERQAGTETQASSPADVQARFEALARRAVQHQLDYAPVYAYFTGLPAPDHRRWIDRSEAAVRAYEAGNDKLLAELRTIDPGALAAGSPTYDILKELLESEAQQRVCRNEFWDVSHMNGWHQLVVQVAQEQPVGTADERTQALQRWRAVPRMIEQEIANLERGLAAGYSSPKTVVQRVVKQISGLAGAPADKSPLGSPAQRSDDAAFREAFNAVVANEVNPALAGYRDYLRDKYLPRAREALGVSANPNGEQCYQAALRGYTTLGRSAREVFELGQRTVERNALLVQDLGERKFGTRDLPTILERIRKAPDNQYASMEELIAASREIVNRARDRSAALFAAMPAQEVLVEPFREYMRGSGASSHYELNVDESKPAYFRIATDNWREGTRSEAEITAVHEAYPGHHMQISFARTLEPHDVSKLSFNSAYVEGWARYSEALAEEAGMYESAYTPMSRRIWPARGMVADPGLHVFGWTREQTRDYLVATGRFSPTEAEDLVDRMAILPGQLTAYDSGGLEIMALRELAERELGVQFDIREFHGVVLGQGVVPLATLRRNVETWIARRQQGIR